MPANLNQWVIDFMEKEATVAPGKAIVVGQSGGGWGAIALSSLNPSSVRAIITFAAGRGGRVDGKPNNNCAPDKLVEATRNFGRNPAFQCFGFTRRTTHTLARTWQIECTRRLQRRAGKRSFECSRRLEATATS